MSQFMIVAVTETAPEGSRYREIMLLDGKFGFKNDKYWMWKAISYATGTENPFDKDIVGLVVDEKGTKRGDIILDKPYAFIWGDNKQEIISKFLRHDFEPLF